MALEFEDDEYITCEAIPSGISSFHPMTLACWVQRPDVLNKHYALSIGGGYTSPTQRWSNSIFVTTTTINARSYFSTSTGDATSTQALSANTWYHVIAVFSASNSRACYVDGGNKGTDSTALSPNDGQLVRVRLGSSAQSQERDLQELDGYGSEFAIWNTALTDDDVAAIGGCAPYELIKPGNLVFHHPAVNKKSKDLFGLPQTITGTLTKIKHTRTKKPVNPPSIYTAGGQAVGGGEGEGGIRIHRAGWPFWRF
jgi:hypothetical protein